MATRKPRHRRQQPLSSWTLRQRLTHCRAIFGAAVEWGYIERNPFVASASSGSSPLRVRAHSGPWHHLTPGEFAELLTVVSSSRRRAAYWLMYGSGLRPGEVYNLTIDRVDLAHRRVRIASRSPSDDLPPFTVKCEERSNAARERMVPIPEAAVPDITQACQLAFKSGGLLVLRPERYQRVRELWGLCWRGLPWGGRAQQRPWQNRDMINNLLRDTKAYLRKAEIELTAPFTLHTFRKSFAQNHADAGTPPRTLAKLLGHSDASVTMEYYNRVTDANEKAAADTMDRILAAPQKRAQGSS